MLKEITGAVASSVSPSVPQSVRPSVRPSLSPSVPQFVRPSVPQSVCPSVRSSVRKEFFGKPYFWPKAPNHPRARRIIRSSGLKGHEDPSFEKFLGVNLGEHEC